MAISWRNKEQQVEPYNKLALIYDDVMSHVKYETWANYVSRTIKKYNPSAISLVDIACGTGSLLFELYSYDYKLFGFDYSFSMITQARKKFFSLGCFVPLWQENIKRFSLKYPVDVIICLYDSLNYVITLDECNEIFKCAFDSLQEKGLFIFDICTEKNSIKYFDNFFERNKGKNYSYSRKSNYNHATRIHSNIFKINFKQANVTFVEIHKQKIYYIDELKEAINETKFEIVDVFDGFSFNPASENSLRVHFVLKKV